LARASAIPARYCSVYAPGVEPPDFHAVAEVFLADPTTPGGGAWHIVDATGMADPASAVKIGVGRDAADVSFMTAFGEVDFDDKMVAVSKVP
jgi:transglutaminase-like putative cysteine protease